MEANEVNVSRFFINIENKYIKWIIPVPLGLFWNHKSAKKTHFGLSFVIKSDNATMIYRKNVSAIIGSGPIGMALPCISVPFVSIHFSK